MVDVSEKTLGSIVRELESQRDNLRRDLDKINAQLELLAGLVKGKMPSASGSGTSSSAGGSGSSISSGGAGTSKRRRGRPPKSGASAAAAKPASTKSSGKKKRGRPAKSTKPAAAKAHTSATKAKPKSKSGGGSGGTLKEELFSIAKGNNGTFRIREAAQSLVKSGRYDTAERAAANIHAAIKYYTSNFVKEGSERGMYKVKP